MLYQYSALTNKRNIRLIKLSDIHTQDRLLNNFDICQVSLDEAPDFRALSYRWGDTKPTRKILLNSRVFYLRENLWRFLLQLRKDKDQHFYWIDAICINQKDNEEKGHRVYYMDEIYAQASKVIVWLSYSPQHEAQLKRLIHARKHRSNSSPDLFNDELYIARKKIQALEYWSRAWIVQEIALGRSIILKCLSASMPFDVFQAQCERDKEQTSDPHVTHCTALLRRVKHLHTAQTEFDLLQWLRDLRSLHCTDDRDRIYSLMGIYRQKSNLPGHEQLLKVDYTRPLSVVKLDCFFMLLSHTEPKDEAECRKKMASLMEWLTMRYQQPTKDKDHQEYPFVTLANYIRDSDAKETFWHLAKTAAGTVMSKMVVCSALDSRHEGPLPTAIYRTGVNMEQSLIDDTQISARLGLNLIAPASDEGKMIRRVLEYLVWRCGTCGSALPALVTDGFMWHEFGDSSCTMCRTINDQMVHRMSRPKSATSITASAPKGGPSKSLCLGAHEINRSDGSLHFHAEMHSPMTTLYETGVVGWFQLGPRHKTIVGQAREQAPRYKLIIDSLWEQDAWRVTSQRAAYGKTQIHRMARETMTAVHSFLTTTGCVLYMRSHRYAKDPPAQKPRQP